MAPQVIFADRAFTPYEELVDAVVVVAGGKIAEVGRRGDVSIPVGASRREARGLTIVPGFVDVHIPGAAGHDAMEGTSEALEAIATAVARLGTTSLVATTVTASEERTCGAVAGIAHWMKSQGAQPRAFAAGGNSGRSLEGPFISVHGAAFIRSSGSFRRRCRCGRNF